MAEKQRRSEPQKVSDMPPVIGRSSEYQLEDIPALMEENGKLKAEVERLTEELKQANTTDTPSAESQETECFADIFQVLGDVASGRIEMWEGKMLWRQWVGSLSPETRAVLVKNRNDIARRMFGAAEGLGQDLQSLID